VVAVGFTVVTVRQEGQVAGAVVTVLLSSEGLELVVKAMQALLEMLLAYTAEAVVVVKISLDLLGIQLAVTAVLALLFSL
tara:strand:- start:402 stop:641 length:240 start_codon:yes stop_codon:yes gene_type:complete